MIVEQSCLPLLTILSSVLAIPLIVATGEKNPNLREAWSVIAGAVKFVTVVLILNKVLAGMVLECEIFRILPGVSLKFKADHLSVLFALGASFLWIITTFYSIGYMRGHGEKKQTRYYSCFAGALSSTMGIAFSANLFTMFLFYEILTVITYPLVAHHETPEAKAGARKYAIYLIGAAKIFLVLAIVITYNMAGTLEFQRGGIFPSEVVDQNKGILSALLLMYFYGFAKGAAMPLHGWLPAAMVAPTPVSALLHAVAVVKSGVFTIVRTLLYVFGEDTLLKLYTTEVALFIVAFTITVGSIIALTRDNLKARLAYSTVSHLSYILLGTLLLSKDGLIGGIIHISNHAFAKMTLFFCAGSIYVCAHKTEVSQLDGIAKKLPITMAAFTIGALGMVGIPIVGGFITKWYLLLGALEANKIWVVWVLLISSILNAAYFFPIVYKAYFKEFKEDHHGHHGHHEIKENVFMAATLAITAVISVLMGFYPDLIIKLAMEVAK